MTASTTVKIAVVAPIAESQSQDGDQRETGLTNQAAEGKAHVGHVRLLPTTPSSVPGVRP